MPTDSDPAPKVGQEKNSEHFAEAIQTGTSKSTRSDEDELDFPELDQLLLGEETTGSLYTSQRQGPKAISDSQQKNKGQPPDRKGEHDIDSEESLDLEPLIQDLELEDMEQTDKQSFRGGPEEKRRPNPDPKDSSSV